MYRPTRQLVWWMPLLSLLWLILAWPMDYCSLLWAQTPRPLRSPSQSQRPGGSPPVSAVQPRVRADQVKGITVQNGLLSVDVREQDIRAVIETIAIQGNIDVRHLDGIPSIPISIRFTSLPMPQGLQRLLHAAAIPGYVLVTDVTGERVMVRRILFLASSENLNSGRSSPVVRRASPTLPQPPAPPASATPTSPQAESEREEPLQTSGGSVFEDIKTNTTARRLLSQLVHPNEQVRERALERLVQLVGDDKKQAELLEFIEPIMDDLASEDKTARDEARAELRKLLSR